MADSGFPYIAREYLDALPEHYRSVSEHLGSSREHLNLVREHLSQVSEDLGGVSEDLGGTSEDWDVMREDSGTVTELLTSARLVSTTMCGHFDTNSEVNDSARRGLVFSTRYEATGFFVLIRGRHRIFPSTILVARSIRSSRVSADVRTTGSRRRRRGHNRRERYERSNA